MTAINIANDFSRTPAGRTEADHGSNSGEAFRIKHLVPKLKEAISSRSKLVVVLDGTAGYPVSFLDEAFGGLVRVDRIDKDKIIQHLEVKAETPHYEIYKELCWKLIKDS